LAAAAASAKGWYLHSLRAVAEDRNTLHFSPSILQHLPPQHLTSLTLQLSHYDSTAEHLTRLTSLRQLCLKLYYGPITPLLPLVQHLTQLTSIDLTNEHPGADLRLLPPQLQQMFWVTMPGATYPGGKLQLTHLTALRHLKRSHIEPTDQLPPNITSLETFECSDFAPLRPLQQLRALTFMSPTMGAAELQQLPRILPALQELNLQYDDTNTAVEASSAWGRLAPALTCLSITNYGNVYGEWPFPGSILQQQLPLLGSSLQKFCLTSYLQYDITPADLTAVLGMLTALTSLELNIGTILKGAWAQQQEQQEEREEQENQIMLAIAGLGNLSELCVWRARGAGALHLTRLTSLKHLYLKELRLEDAIVSALVMSMPHCMVVL
jgi:hypothetical protein